MPCEEATLQKAIALREAGDISESIRLLIGLEKESVDPEQGAAVLTNLATSLAAKGDFASARVQVDAAMRVLSDWHPFRPYAMLIQASIMQEQGEVRAAKKRFEELLAMDLLTEEEHRELWVDALGRFACSLVTLGEYREAIPHLKKALQLSIEPERLQSLHLNLGIANEALGERDEAAKSYHLSAESSVNKAFAADAQFRLGCLSYEAGAFASALEHFQEAEKLERNWPKGGESISEMLKRTKARLLGGRG
jgi:tetratricopeptide (TPR) repeat protein